MPRALNLIGALALTLAVTACATQQEPQTEPANPQPQTPAQTTQTRTPETLTIVFQRQKDPAALQAQAEQMGRALEQEIGIPVKVVVPQAYSASVQALVSNQAQVAYLSSLPFLLASNETPLEILLAEERDGKTSYDAVFVVPKDSPAQTLADLKGKTMAWTSSTSASGYVFPAAFLIEQNLIEPGADPLTFFGRTSFAGGYDKALFAVLRGQADVAAVSAYTVEGPTADKYLTAEDRAKLRVLARVPNVPTHLLAARADLPAELKAKIAAAFLKISQADPELLKDVYGAAALVKADPGHADPTREAVEAMGPDLGTLVE